MKKNLYKIAKWAGLLMVLSLLCGYIWVRGIYQEGFEGSEFEQSIARFETTPNLPENFYATLEKVHPDMFQSSWVGHLISEEVMGGEKSHCPCWKLSKRTMGIESGSMLKNRLFEPSLAWAYESNLTQKQCLNVELKYHDFMNGYIGINAAARGYFGNELKALELDEQLELILMMRNSSLFNKLRRPELILKEVEDLKERVLKSE